MHKDDGGDDKKSPVMSRSVSHPSRREKTIYRRQSQNDRMTQSMYDTNSTSSTPTSGVTFFVDLNDVVSKEENVEKSANRRTTNAAIILKTMSREESDRDLTDVSEDMQIKSKMLVRVLSNILHLNILFFAFLPLCVPPSDTAPIL